MKGLFLRFRKNLKTKMMTIKRKNEVAQLSAPPFYLLIKRHYPNRKIIVFKINGKFVCIAVKQNSVYCGNIVFAFNNSETGFKRVAVNGIIRRNNKAYQNYQQYLFYQFS